jgi:tryptophanyl-tRNA synthetase
MTTILPTAPARPGPAPEPHVRLSLLKPTGGLTLGNYLGALRPMAEHQHPDCFYGLADLHAMTVTHDPGELRRTAGESVGLMLACGLTDVTLFRQSRVPAHTELGYLLECTAHTGELGRMIQYKEKGRDVPGTRVSLFTYPVLMAADILLHRPTQVPVGDDQRQHGELTRDLAIRFNTTYGAVFTVPEIVVPPVGARVMDLQQPTAKMGKSAAAASGGVVRLLDPPDVVRRKVARAVTDSDTGPTAVRRDRAAKPGVTNLLEVLEACGGSADRISTYGALKAAVTDAVVAALAPVQRRYAELAAEPEVVEDVLARGEERCRARTTPVVEQARAAMGM